MDEHFSFGTHLLFTSINFFILILALYFFGRKKLIEGMKERGRKIKNEISTIEAEREEVKNLKMEYVEKMKGLDEEIENMKKRAIEEVEKLAEELRKKIMDSSKRFEESIDQLIKGEYERTILSVQREIVDMAVDIAKRIIKEKLGEEQEKRFFDEVISIVEKK